MSVNNSILSRRGPLLRCVAAPRRFFNIKSCRLSIFQWIVLAFLALLAWHNNRFMTFSNDGISISSEPSLYSPITTTIVRKRPFLLWEDVRGISLPNLFAFIQERLEAPLRQRWDPWLIFSIDENAIWISHRILDQYQDQKLDKERMRNRLNPADEIFYQALELVKQEHSNNKATTTDEGEWPFLRSAIRRGGFPFVVFVGDACVEQKRDGHILPIFNLCVPVHSKNAFAFATYQTWLRAEPNKEQWINVTFEEQKYLHPWETKIAKAVWRGTPTGFLDDKNENQRWRFCRIGQTNTEIMDVGFHVNPPAEQAALNMSVVRLVPGMPEDHFMKYQAIFDLDGNFWSQRFGTLLCSNSVILKVEPQWVDYFHFTLEPWKHYIPVKGDLSDLVEQVKFVVADENEWTVRNIVANANLWCATQMVKAQLVRDFLDSLDWYAQQLDRGDANWPSTWDSDKKLLFAEKNKMQMRTTTPLY